MLSASCAPLGSLGNRTAYRLLFGTLLGEVDHFRRDIFTLHPALGGGIEQKSVKNHFDFAFGQTPADDSFSGTVAVVFDFVFRYGSTTPQCSCGGINKKEDKPSVRLTVRQCGDLL